MDMGDVLEDVFLIFVFVILVGVNEGPVEGVSDFEFDPCFYFLFSNRMFFIVLKIFQSCLCHFFFVLQSVVF